MTIGRSRRDLVDLRIRRAGEFVQVFEADALIAFRLNAPHDDVVVCSSCVQHIRYGDEADVEALLHLFLLPFDGGFFGVRRIERRLAAQHFEICRNRADDQVLFGRDVVLFGLGLQRVGAFVRVVRGDIDDRLHQLRLPRVVVEFLTGNAAQLAEVGARGIGLDELTIRIFEPVVARRCVQADISATNPRASAARFRCAPHSPASPRRVRDRFQPPPDRRRRRLRRTRSPSQADKATPKMYESFPMTEPTQNERRSLADSPSTPMHEVIAANGLGDWQLMRTNFTRSDAASLRSTLPVHG